MRQFRHLSEKHRNPSPHLKLLRKPDLRLKTKSLAGMTLYIIRANSIIRANFLPYGIIGSSAGRRIGAAVAASEKIASSAPFNVSAMAIRLP